MTSNHVSIDTLPAEEAVNLLKCCLLCIGVELRLLSPAAK